MVQELHDGRRNRGSSRSCLTTMRDAIPHMSQSIATTEGEDETSGDRSLHHGARIGFAHD